METHPVPEQPTDSATVGPILQFIFSLLVAFVAFFIALVSALSAIMPQFSAGLAGGLDPASFLLAAGAFAAGVMLSISAWFALLRLLGKPERWLGTLHEVARSLTQPLLLAILFAVALLLGYWVSKNTALGWLLPPLHLAAVLIPLYGIIRMGQMGLPVGSLERAWGVFAAGLAGGPAMAMIAEILAGVAFLVIGMIYVSTQPGLMQQLLSLAQSLRSPTVTQEELLRALGPYLQRPEVLAAILAYTAGVVPLIEELCKPVGVWLILLLGKKVSPAQGFTTGLLSGAGFAFFENLTLTAQVQDWAPVVIARIGTALLHIVTTGLMGWALALTWRDRKALRLLPVYAVNVLIHGTWNGMALLAAAPSLDLFGSQTLGVAAGVVLLVLAVLMLLVLLWANFKLRSTSEEGEQIIVGG